MTVNRTLARRYATAVFALAVEAKAVERVGSDLERIVSTIEGDELASQFFLAPIVDRHTKERVLAEAFGGRVDDIAFHSLLLLVRKHRERLLRPIIEEFRALEMSSRGLEPLTVTSARPLSAGELERIAQRVAKIYGQTFEPRLVVDPRLIGGLRIAMGDRLVDGTIDGRLTELARMLEPATTS